MKESQEKELPKVSYWLDIHTEYDEPVARIQSPTALEELQTFKDGIPLGSHQQSKSIKDFGISIGTELNFDDRKYKVQNISLTVRDGQTYGEIRIFVTVREL